MTDSSTPFEPIFSEPECIAHLADMMRGDPDAASWHFDVSWCVIEGSIIESVPASRQAPAWETEWPTYQCTSASLRLQAPPDRLADMHAFLQNMQRAHTEAVGGPMDGLRYRLGIFPARTRVSMFF